MSERLHPLAGRPAPPESLVDVPRLITAYYTEKPDPSIATQRVAFGTSGHRGTSFEASFNENHVLTITQAICEYRAAQGVNGPLFIGFDTHALSAPAYASALEVLAANGVDVMVSAGGEYTPTPAVSQAILSFNRGRSSGLSDGIVITPSHNPPDSGGFKYNPSNGGPADTDITRWIETRANELLANQSGVKRITLASAMKSSHIHAHDYMSEYVAGLSAVIDMDTIRASGVRMGVDPLGGAGVHYWQRIAEVYALDLEVVSDAVDPTFRFMTLDWDGKIRMDPSSIYAMQRLVGLKDKYDIAFGCDTDHDRHGVVAPSSGLMQPNSYLATMVDYLFRHRDGWRKNAAVGKTVVSSVMIDRVARRLGRPLYETPTGFKWFVDGLYNGALGFGGEESAGASFLRIDGLPWSTDKDGIAPALLSAEITARSGKDPGAVFADISSDLGATYADRIDAPATAQQKQRLGKLDASQVKAQQLAGDPIEQILTAAPANGASIGGLKVVSRGGWFAARPSGTESIYKIYAESFHDKDHLQRLIAEAQSVVNAALTG